MVENHQQRSQDIGGQTKMTITTETTTTKIGPNLEDALARYPKGIPIVIGVKYPQGLDEQSLNETLNSLGGIVPESVKDSSRDARRKQLLQESAKGVIDYLASEGYACSLPSENELSYFVTPRETRWFVKAGNHYDKKIPRGIIDNLAQRDDVTIVDYSLTLG